jgi:hypothetical protein
MYCVSPARYSVEGAVALHGACPQVRGADEERRRGRRPRLAPDRQRDAQQQHQREEWVDDGDRVPRHAHVGERPEEQCAVGGAGIEQSVRGVSGRRGAEVRLPVRPRATRQQPGERGERAADRDERQRVREVAVEFGIEERVGAAANQRVDVGQQRPRDTGEPGRLSQRARKNDPRRRRAEERMRERIHGDIVLRLLHTG